MARSEWPGRSCILTFYRRDVSFPAFSRFIDEMETFFFSCFIDETGTFSHFHVITRLGLSHIFTRYRQRRDVNSLAFSRLIGEPRTFSHFHIIDETLTCSRLSTDNGMNQCGPQGERGTDSAYRGDLVLLAGGTCCSLCMTAK